MNEDTLAFLIALTTFVLSGLGGALILIIFHNQSACYITIISSLFFSIIAIIIESELNGDEE
jgi:hypothetical protein